MFRPCVTSVLMRRVSAVCGGCLHRVMTRGCGGMVGAGDARKKRERRASISQAPSLKGFMVKYGEAKRLEVEDGGDTAPYIERDALSGRGKKVCFEVRGCQMNVNDAEIAWSVLRSHEYERVESVDDADVILVVTCSIRDSAEQKVWQKISNLKSLKKKRLKKRPLKIGILGCMAERLKKKILEREDCVDIIAGPDAYKDLPLLLASSQLTGQAAVNVVLSFDETYADVMPVRLNEDSVTAFVSIMRGCDNMCSYCIVPFTRGRERSRPLHSILEEVRGLSDQGVKEVTLLGQNVNSYRDTSSTSMSTYEPMPGDHMSRGFSTIYRRRSGGLTFVHLLDEVSRAHPHMRIRFTSPHPKDFPDPVLQLIRERVNICKQLHMPAQSGCSMVLDRMRRGYTREAYLELVDNIRNIIPGVHLTSDFITGFCGETEESHRLTMELVQRVQYNFIYVFPYSMRQKTHASHKLVDDVPKEVKDKRAEEVSSLFRQICLELNTNMVGTEQCVLVEKPSRRTQGAWTGKTDGGVRVVLAGDVPMEAGDYVAARVTGATSQTLRATPLYQTSLQLYYSERDEVKMQS